MSDVGVKIEDGDILLKQDRWYLGRAEPISGSGYFVVPRAIADISYNMNAPDKDLIDVMTKDHMSTIRSRCNDFLQRYEDTYRNALSEEFEKESKRRAKELLCRAQKRIEQG